MWFVALTSGGCDGVLTSHIVGTWFRLSELRKPWLSAYSDRESVGEENRELLDNSSKYERSWENTNTRD